MYFKKNKYRNCKVTTEDGLTFDSRKEYTRYLELYQMQKEGLISELKCQEVIHLIPSQKLTTPRVSKSGKRVLTEKPVDYIADFTYWDKDGNKVIEDTKGVRTKEYVIKRKLLKYLHGIEINEI